MKKPFINMQNAGLIIISLAGMLIISGCTRQEKTLGGAALGAGIGAGIGGAAGGGGGAAGGAIGGGILGGLIGHNMGDDEE